MPLTARIRASQQGQLIPMDLQVPHYARRTFNHQIYWSKKSHASASAYNYIAEVYNEPCLRRWLEFCFGEPEKSIPYKFCYTPPAVHPHPERIWVLYDGDMPVATYTNLIEGWMIVLGGRAFGNNHNLSLHYIDRTV